MSLTQRVVPVYEPKPMGIIAQVHIDVWKAITESADELGYTTFIELGTYRGGTGIYFVERCKQDAAFKYLGVDLHPEWMDSRFVNSFPGVANAKIILGSVFDESIQQQVHQVLHQRGLTLVFMDCGGENLKRATREYAPLLKAGDYLVIHDYPDEIDDSDIEYVLSQGYEWVDKSKWLEKLNTPLFRKR